MNTTHYDLLVIGAGAAGSSAANTAESKGARVALVERDKIGGTCLNYGCDPTKTLLHIANIRRQARSAEKYGLRIPSADLEWKCVQEYVRHVINQIRGGTPDEAAAALASKHITVIHGNARFISPHEVMVADQLISAEHVVIATGCQPTIPPIKGLEQVGFITNVEAVTLPALPRRLVIIGGGAISLEFAQMFQRFGVEVTVLEKSPQLLSKEDRELADMLCELLTGEGIHMETDAELLSIHHATLGKELIYRCKEDERHLVVDEILLATGRHPAVDELNLAAAGVQMGERGIKVDDTLRTNVPHIWAAGDVTGGYQFTHFAFEQGKVAANNVFAKQPQPFGERAIPWVTYTDPPLAHVGKTEEQLRQQDITYKVSRMKFNDVERAVSSGYTEGLVKLLVDQRGSILGGHILGVDADNLLAPLVVAMDACLPASALASTILPYPTYSEAIRWAADRV